MPNPGWQVSPREQMQQDQLQLEHHEFQAWKLEMSKDLAQGSQPQGQASLLMGSSGPSNDIDAPGDVVINKSGRSASAKGSRSQDQTSNVSKRARLGTTPQRSSSPKRDYPQGTSTATRPTPSSLVEDRPVQAQDLADQV